MWQSCKALRTSWDFPHLEEWRRIQWNIFVLFFIYTSLLKCSANVQHMCSCFSWYPDPCCKYIKYLCSWQRKDCTVLFFSWCSVFYSPSPLSGPWNLMHCEQMPLLHLCSPSLRSLKSEVNDRNQISPHYLPVCKIEMSLSLETRWNSHGVLELVRVRAWEMVSVLRGNKGSPREREVSAAASVWCLHYI